VLRRRCRYHHTLDDRIRKEIVERGRPGYAEPLTSRSGSLFEGIDDADKLNRRQPSREIASVYPPNPPEPGQPEADGPKIPASPLRYR
jgi:hypothetical protein